VWSYPPGVSLSVMWAKRFIFPAPTWRQLVLLYLLDADVGRPLSAATGPTGECFILGGAVLFFPEIWWHFLFF